MEFSHKPKLEERKVSGISISERKSRSASDFFANARGASIGCYSNVPG